MSRILNNVLFVGNPNAGKTTLYNAFTGGKYKTGNYPGVTVDYAYGSALEKFNLENCRIIDTPGIRSLSPSSIDEEIAIRSIFDHPKFGTANLIICISDANQLSRHLFLFKQLQDAGFPVICVLTMMDILDQKNLTCDVETLSHKMQCPVIALSYKSDDDLHRLADSIRSELTLQKTVEIQSQTNMEVSELIARYHYLSEIEDLVIRPKKSSVKLEGTLTEKLDRFFLHPIFGGLIFLVIMLSLFSSIFWFAQPFMDWIDQAFGSAISLIQNKYPDHLIARFFSEAVLGGVGAVVVFLPQIIILFFLLGILEDSGYLSRAAVIVDAPLKKIGLSGRSFVPMLSGFACAIPAMLAARTIKNPLERFAVIFVIPLMTCSARLPVFTLLLALLFPAEEAWKSGLALMMIYVISIIISSLIAFFIYVKLGKKQEIPFALELPEYRLPLFSNIWRMVRDKSKSYLKTAGTVILYVSMIIWCLSTFPYPDSSEINESYIGQAGFLIEPVLEPMGLDWRSGIAILSSFAAREVFVSSMVQIYRISDEADSNTENRLTAELRKAKKKDGSPLFQTPSIISLIVFYIFALLCFPTISVAKQEFASWKTAMIQVSVFFILAYVLSVAVYQLLV